MPRAKKQIYVISRRSRKIIFILCLALLIYLVRLDHGSSFLRIAPPPNSKADQLSYDIQKYDAKSFTVVNVVDGDTIDIDIPDIKYETTRIRLLGVDTPETKNPKTGPMYFGRQASEFTKELTLGKKITVFLDKNGNTRGKYGRLLAYVKLPDGSFLNEVLLKEGYAYADLRFRHSLYQKYSQLESLARNSKAGLWKEVTKAQLPYWLNERKPNLIK